MDFEAKYRFFCEDHVIRINQYSSDWFITRIRMMHIVKGENYMLPSGLNKENTSAIRDPDDSDDPGPKKKRKRGQH